MKKYSLLFFFSLFFTSKSFSQITLNQLGGGDTSKTITTAVPFLLISPDARAGGMGDAGVATSADANSIHWNPSKLGFINKKFGVSLSYVPWLRALNITDISLTYFSGFYRITKRQTIAGSLRYFSIGSLQLTSATGSYKGKGQPKECAADLSYACRLSRKFALGVSVRYINSSLATNNVVGIIGSKAAQAVSGDLSGNYVDSMKINSTHKRILSIGYNISNVGSKISYTTSAVKNFIPINLRIGSAYTIYLDRNFSFTYTLDLNKLLVPTPPRYSGNPPVITAGKDPNVSVVHGMLQSFNDAPLGREEELQEITISNGCEIWYKKMFALRCGYFYESPTKGNRKYLTIGAGLSRGGVTLDVSYLVTQQYNPLKNTVRFTASYCFQKKTKS